LKEKKDVVKGCCRERKKWHVVKEWESVDPLRKV